MRIAELTLSLVRVPLRRTVRHASAERTESLNLVACCRLADGTQGWGEGVPRPYVTGETPEGALGQFAATPWETQLDGSCEGWPDAIALCRRLQPAAVRDDPRGCHGNALRCAVELSVLDAFGRLWAQPLAAVTPHVAPELHLPQERVRYSGAITADSPARERVAALKMRAYGFRHCKVKVGLAGGGEAARLRTIRRWLGRRIDLRLDANEAWSARDYVATMRPLLACRPSCIEQPVGHHQLGALAAVRRDVPVPVMLDESLASPGDARRAIALGACDLFNIRLSKCGGFVASLELAALARRSGLGYQLGCHPGETGILSAAGRHWATSVRDLRYLEGSYDRHLLCEQLTVEDMTFGYGGRAAALYGAGLGVTIDAAVLSRWTIRQEVRPLR